LGAVAAAEVQQFSATSALKDNKALLKALQKKLTQHDKQEGQHKTQVTWTWGGVSKHVGWRPPRLVASAIKLSCLLL
jgi:hypothetical protein